MLRERGVRDVLELATFLSESGKLRKLNNGQNEYCDESARELAVFASISANGGRRVLHLLSLIPIRGLLEFFESHAHLRVFSAEVWLAYDNPSTAFDLMSPKIPSLIKHASKDLRCYFCESFCDVGSPIRDRLVVCFFQITAVLATIAGWFHPHSRTANLQDIMRKYLCPSWNTSGMSAQLGEDFSNGNMHAGWSFVNIAFFDLRNKSWRTEEAYNENPSKLTVMAFCEFLSWSFCMMTISNAESFQRSVEEIGLMVLQKMSDEINDGAYDQNLLRFLYQNSLRERLRGTGKEDGTAELPLELAHMLPKVYRNDRTQCGTRKRSVQETDLGHPLSKRTRVENTNRTCQLASHHLMAHGMSSNLVPSTTSPLRPSRTTDKNHDMTANFVTDIPPPLSLHSREGGD